jgi:hypothetical protein
MVGLIGPTLPALRANVDVSFERLGRFTGHDFRQDEGFRIRGNGSRV